MNEVFICLILKVLFMSYVLGQQISHKLILNFTTLHFILAVKE